MTDQTEPKYTEGTHVLLTNGEVRTLGLPRMLNDVVPAYDLKEYGLVFEKHILYPVSIHPNSSVKPKCKDCELSKDEDGWVFGDCPISKWAVKNGSIEWINLTDDTEPPPNCYCFTPRLTPKGDNLPPDEKESK